MKQCNRCNVEKELNEFHKLSKGKDGCHPTCKDCRNLAQREKWKTLPKEERAKKNKDRSKRNHLKKYDLKKKYGLTLEAYNTMVEEQNNLCAICNKEEKDIALAVDHCHSTNSIRGLLCKKCNIGLGMFLDEPDLLNKASEYLKENGR